MDILPDMKTATNQIESLPQAEIITVSFYMYDYPRVHHTEQSFCECFKGLPRSSFMFRPATNGKRYVEYTWGGIIHFTLVDGI